MSSSLPISSEWSEFTRTAALLLDPKAHVEQFYRQNTRPDGRLFAQARSTTIQQGILTKHTVGSALVTLGGGGGRQSSSVSDKVANEALTCSSSNNSTLVLAAVTLQVGQPTTSSDCPAGEGDVVVNVVDDVKPGANSSNSSDANPINVAILQSFLQRVMDVCIQAARDDKDEASADTESKQQQHPLVLIPGKAAWRLMISVQILQAAGNVADACVLAAVAAVLNAQIPTIDAMHVAPNDGSLWWNNDDDDDDNTDDTEIQKDDEKPAPKTKQLHLTILPIPLSMGLWVPPSPLERDDDEAMIMDTTNNDDDDDPKPPTEPCWMVDPDDAEEECLSTMCCIVVNAAANSSSENDILLLDLSGETAICPASLALAMQMAKGRAQELRSVLLPTANK